uniref:F-box domain-containing protein n=1 Tax=Clastoptera arizonana TaxID=38151 RepID=A0A1B6EAF3_9HEMI
MYSRKRVRTVENSIIEDEEDLKKSRSLPNNDQENENNVCKISTPTSPVRSQQSLQCVENVMITPPDEKKSFIKKKKYNQLTARQVELSSLSDEIILMIFQYLPQKNLIICAQVCEKWKRIAYDESLWERIDLACSRLKSDQVAYMLQRNPKVLRMAQSEFISPVLKTLPPSVGDLICQVQYLDLSMAHITRQDLAKLLSKCCNLRKLSVEHCVTDIAVCASIANNSHLQVLNMSQCYLVEREGLEEILLNCSELKQLNLAWTNLQQDDIDTVCKLVNKDIEELNLSGCGKELLNSNIADLVSQCKSLIRLDLSDCLSITHAVIDIIINNLDDLQELSLSRCYSIKLPHHYMKFTAMKSLKYLNLFGIFPKHLEETIKNSIHPIEFNKNKFSTIARPTVGIRRSSIWGQRTHD